MTRPELSARLGDFELLVSALRAHGVAVTEPLEQHRNVNTQTTTYLLRGHPVSRIAQVTDEQHLLLRDTPAWLDLPEAMHAWARTELLARLLIRLWGIQPTAALPIPEVQQ